MNKLFHFILLLVGLFFLLFILFIIKVNIESVFEGEVESQTKEFEGDLEFYMDLKEIEGMNEVYYDSSVKYNNTKMTCDDFCKNMTSIPENCDSFNNSKVQKCLDPNNVPIQPKCRYKDNVCNNIA